MSLAENHRFFEHDSDEPYSEINLSRIDRSYCINLAAEIDQGIDFITLKLYRVLIQGTRCKTSELTVTNIEVVKNVASFLA